MVLAEYEFLDQFRHPKHPDDVKVFLVKEGLEPELCPVHLEAADGNVILGILASEPQQDFGYHKGERIAFFLHTDSRGTQVLISDMNPSMKLTQADLEDGSMLRAAIKTFNDDRTQEHFIDVLEFLRDSQVWIPCDEVLMNGDDYFLPVFSGIDEMGDYGNDFPKVQKHFLEAINLAMGNENDVVGIVIDAFSEPMVIDKELFDMIWSMKSRLV